MKSDIPDKDEIRNLAYKISLERIIASIDLASKLGFHSTQVEEPFWFPEFTQLLKAKGYGSSFSHHTHKYIITWFN